MAFGALLNAPLLDTPAAAASSDVGPMGGGSFGGISTNAFFVSGALVMLAGFVASWVRSWVWKVYRKVQEQFFVRVTVSSRDEAFYFVTQWLAEHEYSKSARNVKMQTMYDPKDTRDSDPAVLLVPADGDHFLMYKGKYLWVNRKTENGGSDGGGRGNYRSRGGESIMEEETLTICFFSWPFSDKAERQKLVVDLVEEARRAWVSKADGHTSVYVSSGNRWSLACTRAHRPVGSVVLRHGLASSLVDDARTFLASRAWYAERGIPYRRGYLFHGPPGCGKTSFILALAAEIDASMIYVLNLSDPALSDAQLNSLLNRTRPGSLVLFEDVDAAFVQRQAGSEKKNAISFSGLLNALDGVYSQEGRMVFMTTNHIEKLCPALIRPGRVDVQREFALADRGMLRGIFEKFYATKTTSDGDEDDAMMDEGSSECRTSEDDDDERLEELCETFTLSIPENAVSMAEVQGFLLVRRGDPEAAAREARQWYEDLVDSKTAIENVKKETEVVKEEKHEEEKLEEEAMNEIK